MSADSPPLPLPCARFARCDLMTTDPEGSRAFYEAVVGWSFPERSSGGFTYPGIDAGGVGIGGLMAMDAAAGLPAHWMPYIAVADIDAALARVAGLGGEVCQPAVELPGLGRFSIITDPAGAWVTLMTFEQTPTQYESSDAGRYGWFELVSQDVDAVGAFYAALLDWDAARGVMPGIGDYTTFTKGEEPLAGMLPAPMPETRSHWLGYVKVEDIDARVALAKTLGAEVLHGPATTPGLGRMATIRDPQGAVVGLWGI